MSSGPRLTAHDLAELASAGIAAAEAERQLALLATPPAAARLDRPCTLGDGIERLLPAERSDLLARADAARAAGRLARFVPASGAATRMFRAPAAALEHPDATTLADLRRAAAAGDALAAEAAELIEALPALALTRALAELAGVPVEQLAERAHRDPLAPLFRLLLDPDGFDAARLPKGLLPFHARSGSWVTAFEEQLREGVELLADTRGVCRFHFTVAAESRARFDDALAALRPRLERAGRRLEVGFSVQDPATDALALDADGQPARRADGSLVRRPAGHGALLGNLERTGFDVATIKNIDNVLPPERHAEVGLWKRLLLGRLLELEEELAGWRQALEREPDGTTAERVVAAVAARFGRRPVGAGATPSAAARIAAARALLDRPLRVCGVVPNTGEPGGGPFWVAGADGVTPQIVESAQVDARRPDQVDCFRAATHFNPVDIAVCLRDAAGRPYALERFVDPGAAFVARKSEGGRELVVYERPGLWNGAMAGWNTLFVEVPGSTFAPVKSVLDLARPEHRVPR